MRIFVSLLLIITISILSIFSYIQLNKIISPCDQTKTYRIGTIDPRFGLTRDDLFNSSRQASSLWNATYPNQLLKHAQDGDITINMVFDERQTFLFQITDLETSLVDKEENLNLKNQNFDAKAAEFESKLTKLNNEIQDWNEKGGAPPDIYQNLIIRQQELKEEANTLNAQARELNRSVANYNVEVGELNETVSTYNETLEDKPEGGLFIGGENRIEIYVNNGSEDLRRILAHEMGHALGISHVVDPNSIMFPESNDQSKLSNADISAINEVCQGQKVSEIFLERLNLLTN